MRHNQQLASFKKLIKQIKPYRWGLILTVLSGILKHGSTIGAAALSAYMVGLALEGLFLEQATSLIAWTSVCIAIRIVMYYAEMYIAHDVAFKILVDFRIALFQAVERVSPSILLNMRSGQLATTLMSDVELLEWFFAHTFGSFIVTLVVPLIILLYMGTFHISLIFVMLLFLAIISYVPFIMKKRANRQGLDVREKLAEGNAVTVEGIHGMKEIVTLNYKDSYMKKNLEFMDRLSNSQMSYGKRLGAEGGLIQVFVGLAMISVMAVSIALILRGQMNLAYFPMIIILAAMTFNPVLEITGMARNFGLILAASDRVYTVLESRPTVFDCGRDIPALALDAEVEFDHVSFRYREDLPNAITDISFKVNAGETVALVGPSGAGKSTCFNLLLRYWDPLEGEIKIGKNNIKGISLDRLHSMTTAVLQEVYLFNTSIEENIRMGKQDATIEEIEAAAKAALAHDFIMDMPKGYQSFPGERGNQLSGGQKQRIAIARAILKDAPILLLDEAVSNLDSENEYIIQKALKRLRQGKTTIMIAHRQSTIMAADRVIRLKDGHIEEIKDQSNYASA